MLCDVYTYMHAGSDFPVSLCKIEFGGIIGDSCSIELWTDVAIEKSWLIAIMCTFPKAV